MRRLRIDATQETLVLTGLIVSEKVIKQSLPILDIKLFRSKQAKTIAKWAIDFYKIHDKPVGIHIQDIYNEKAENEEILPEDVQVIGRTLERISREFSRSRKFNEEYVLSVVERFLSVEHLKHTMDLVKQVIDKDPAKAHQIMQNFAPKQIYKTVGIELFTDQDKDLMDQAALEVKEPLFEYPGPFGHMINADLYRGAFLAFMGHEKIGKTWNLMEMAFRSAQQGCHTAMIQCGDMTDKQQMNRMAIRVVGKSNRLKYCGNVLIPIYDCFRNQNGTCELTHRTGDVDLGIMKQREITEFFDNREAKFNFYRENHRNGYVPCSACRRMKKYQRRYWGACWYLKKRIDPYTIKELHKARDQFRARLGKTKFRLASYPAGSLSVNDIDNLMQRWMDQDGTPIDTLIIDYADLLSSGGNDDFRHRVNKIWVDLRGLSQKYNNLVVTATQADANAYTQEKLNMKNFSEDKRKYGHVTSFFTLNQTNIERMMGIMRIGQLLSRDEEFDRGRFVKIMQCYNIGRPFIGSYF